MPFFQLQKPKAVGQQRKQTGRIFQHHRGGLVLSPLFLVNPGLIMQDWLIPDAVLHFPSLYKAGKKCPPPTSQVA